MPKGATSFKNESILDCFADLRHRELEPQAGAMSEPRNLQFNDAADGTDIQDLASELVCKVSDGLQVLVLVS